MWGRGLSPSRRNRCGPEPRRNTGRDDRDQVCLHVVTAVGPRVFRPPGPGMFAAFWDNGLPHGSRLLRAGDVVETLLPVEQGSTFADEAVRCQWRDNGGIVVVKLDERFVDTGAILRRLATDVASAGRLVVDRQTGVVCGGGLPHSQAAVWIRSLPCVRAAWVSVLHAAGRPSDDLGPATADGLLLTKVGGARFGGLPLYTGHRKVHGVAMVSHIQGQVVFSPGLRGYLRTGILTAFPSLTPAVERNHMLAVVTRIAQNETGELRSQSRFPSGSRRIHGGPCLPLRKAMSMSTDALANFVRGNAPAYLTDSLPPVRFPLGPWLFRASRVSLEGRSSRVQSTLAHARRVRGLGLAGGRYVIPSRSGDGNRDAREQLVDCAGSRRTVRASDPTTLEAIMGRGTSRALRQGRRRLRCLPLSSLSSRLLARLFAVRTSSGASGSAWRETTFAISAYAASLADGIVHSCERASPTVRFISACRCSTTSGAWVTRTPSWLGLRQGAGTSVR